MAQTDHIDQSDSISSQDPHNEDKKKVKSRRPANTAFRQQRLKAWQPILTPKTVLPLFFIIGIIFAPIGGGLLYASAQVRELSIDYTKCSTEAPQTTSDAFNRNETIQGLEEIDPKRVVSSFSVSTQEKPKWARTKANYTWPLSKMSVATNVCVLEFNIPENLQPPVLFYYRLTNFYQNHRRYVKSLDLNQLKGKALDSGAIRGGDCDPLKIDKDTGKPYYPCGLIANSMFNDTFPSRLDLINTREGYTGYNFSDKGIAWSTEKELYGKTEYKPSDVVPPPNWKEQFKDGSYESLEELPNLQENEPFQVWMRTAGLPTFSKLALRNDKEELLSGTYRLTIYDRFPADLYGGTKSILISTRTVMGGKNPFLGIAYIVVGGLCIVLGAVFLATHLIKPRKLGDHTYLTWNNDQPSTATTTGRSTRPADSA